MRNWAVAFLAIFAVVAGVSAPIPPSGNAAICVLEATSNNAQPVSGYLHFVELMDTTLQITLVASGLSNGAHTFHVHTFGDISDPSGNSVQGHFVGNCSGCRPPGALQEAGLLNNGNPVTVAGGTVSYTFNEPIAKLSGTNSIVGRSIIIHGTAAGASVRAAQCVIGRWYEPLASPVLRPAAMQATCRFQATSLSPVPVTGVVTFTQLPGVRSRIGVTYNVSGLASGNHGFHVHTWGNVNATAGTSVGGHFFGTCNNTCRPGIGTQEVGYLFDGAGLTADASGRAIGYAVDGNIQLSGNDSILGRSLIIHGNGTSSGAFTAQCVIGEAAVVLPTNCQYGPWSGWTACGSTTFSDIQMSLTTRSRSVTVTPANGGATCDDAVETKPCVDYTASCVLTAGANNRVPVVGTVDFQQTVGLNLSVAVSVSGLVNASHGFHVHVYGDITDPYAMSESGHFIGDCNDSCRPNVTGMLQEVGYLNDGAPLVSTGINAVSVYRFQDSVAKLYGTDSIVGRSIVIHHDGLSAATRVAHCVIGSTGGPLDTPSSQQGSCVLTATSGIGVPTIAPGTVIGNFSFTATATNNVWVSYNMSGLPWSQGISARVYSVGDIRTIDGSSTGELFTGDCSSCRPGAPIQAAGLLFNGANLTTQSTALFGDMVADDVISLVNTSGSFIIGRSLVLINTSDASSPIIAQCVIGNAATSPPVNCEYSAWITTSACVCSNTSDASMCLRNDTRGIRYPPRNGGAFCTSANFTQSTACSFYPPTYSGIQVTALFSFESLGVSAFNAWMVSRAFRSLLVSKANLTDASIFNYFATFPHMQSRRKLGGGTGVFLYVDIAVPSMAVGDSVALRIKTVFTGSSAASFANEFAVQSGLPLSQVGMTLMAADVIDPNAPPKKHSDAGLSAGSKAGIAMGVIFGLAVTGLVIVIAYRRMTKRAPEVVFARNNPAFTSADASPEDTQGFAVYRDNSGRSVNVEPIVQSFEQENSLAKAKIAKE